MSDYRRKFGLVTAISMVAGSVIGSGVFFKSETIAKITDGNVLFGAAAWVVGALVMLLCLLSFAEIMAESSENSLYLTSKKLLGARYSRVVGTFMATMYYPSLVSALSYLAARYTLLSFGEVTPFTCAFLSVIFLAIAFWQNAFSASISGRVQVITTVIKLIPLILMIILGIANGIHTGILGENIISSGNVPFGAAFFPSVTATLFAYEGWISVASIGKMLKNRKRNLPIALIVGGILIAMVYVLYYMGIMGAVKNETLINYGGDGIKTAFSNILGRWGRLLCIFVAVSCYGALCALAMGCGYVTSEVFDKKINHAYFMGVIISFLWLFYLITNQNGGCFRFDSSELPVVTIYALYIPIFFSFLKKKRKIKTTILCCGGIIASLFAVVCGIYAHSNEILSYGAVLVSILLLCKKR